MLEGRSASTGARGFTLGGTRSPVAKMTFARVIGCFWWFGSVACSRRGKVHLNGRESFNESFIESSHSIRPLKEAGHVGDFAAEYFKGEAEDSGDRTLG